MFTVSRGSLEDTVLMFERGEYSRAMFYVKNLEQGLQLLESLRDWEVKRKDLTAKKNNKVITIVFNIEHVYGRSFDYFGITESFPSSEDFLYYISRLRKVI